MQLETETKMEMTKLISLHVHDRVKPLLNDHLFKTISLQRSLLYKNHIVISY